LNKAIFFDLLALKHNKMGKGSDKGVTIFFGSSGTLATPFSLDLASLS
jgi:hypothetical protein